jgi:mono/diheme cytochrome c family protein
MLRYAGRILMKTRHGLCLAARIGLGLAILTPGFSLADPEEPTGDKKKLIDLGRTLFTEETFEGNGRTCASCHRAEHNFTIDPAFIATLPDNDPLFVAEFDPDLAALEDPKLMREFGLILENLEGFDRRPVMRGVPHTLGLSTSMKVRPGHLTPPDAAADRLQAVGWSGDGASLPGGMRDVALEAIPQHFTKTLNREPGVDFRVPTEHELDALEAFQLSLGRQRDVDLAAITFTDPLVEEGKRLFNDGTNRECAQCHTNAGANDIDGFNRNFDTGIALLRDMPASGDGGFGIGPERTHPEFPGLNFSGDGTWNVPSLIEAADTGPFFHNNSFQNLEEAIGFYTTETFANSPEGQSGGGAFELSDDQITAIGAMLRTLNAMENIRNSNEISETAHRLVPRLARDDIALLIADTEDAIQVLTGGPQQLYPDAVAALKEALYLEREALRKGPPEHRNDLLREARTLKQNAREIMTE